MSEGTLLGKEYCSYVFVNGRVASLNIKYHIHVK